MTNLFYTDCESQPYGGRVHHNKPCVRENLLKYGAHTLSDLELMMTLIGTGTKDIKLETLAKEALQVILTNDRAVWKDKLLRVKGLGRTKTAVIIAAMESGERYATAREAKICQPRDALPFLQAYAYKSQEHFVALSLSGAHEVKNVRVISVGTGNKTVVQPRDVFTGALIDHACSIIVAHNHPSGSLAPSAEDYELTKCLLNAAKTIGVHLLDHIIVTKTGYYSFAEETNLFREELIAAGNPAAGGGNGLEERFGLSGEQLSEALLQWLNSDECTL